MEIYTLMLLPHNKKNQKIKENGFKIIPTFGSNKLKFRQYCKLHDMDVIGK